MRQEVGGGLLEGLIYVVGGFDSSGQSVNTVERYDPVAEEWESVPDLPAAAPLNHVGVASAGGRLFVIGGFITSFGPAIGIYIVAALVMKIEPVLPFETEEDHEFYHSYAASRSMALSRLKRTYDSLERRLQRLEGTVTARDYDWEERLHNS